MQILFLDKYPVSEYRTYRTCIKKQDLSLETDAALFTKQILYDLAVSGIFFYRKY